MDTAPENLGKEASKGVNPLGKVTWLASQVLTTLSGHVLADSRGVEPDPEHKSRHEQRVLGHEQHVLGPEQCVLGPEQCVLGHEQRVLG